MDNDRDISEITRILHNLSDEELEGLQEAIAAYTEENGGRQKNEHN